MTIKFGRNGQELGDYPEDQVPELLRTKVVLPTDLFWHEGLPEWKTVASRWPDTAGPVITDISDADAAPSTLPIRGIGALLFGIGAFLTWLCVWSPLQDAANHESSVSLSLKGVLLAPLLVVLGLLYLALPALTVRYIGGPREKKPGMWLLSIPLMIAGGLLYWALKKKLEEMGYAF